jgi:plasmid maintenance system killer protein
MAWLFGRSDRLKAREWPGSFLLQKLFLRTFTGIPLFTSGLIFWIRQSQVAVANTRAVIARFSYCWRSSFPHPSLVFARPSGAHCPGQEDPSTKLDHHQTYLDRLKSTMATALQKQLAVISANSTHQLDLKARKAAHGKSLLFDPKIAVSQDFNSLYQVCFEGFQELCLLDSRYTQFASTIFSEQSKSEEREQLNEAQNAELDLVLQQFLGLVSTRLLLKPAQKAVEWLIRRFRYVWESPLGHAY